MNKRRGRRTYVGNTVERSVRVVSVLGVGGLVSDLAAARRRIRPISPLVRVFLGFRKVLVLPLGACGGPNGGFVAERIDVIMELKGGKMRSSSRLSRYEAPLGYGIEDLRPNGGIKKFQSAAYSNFARKPS